MDLEERRFAAVVVVEISGSGFKGAGVFPPAAQQTLREYITP